MHCASAGSASSTEKLQVGQLLQAEDLEPAGAHRSVQTDAREDPMLSRWNCKLSREACNMRSCQHHWRAAPPTRMLQAEAAVLSSSNMPILKQLETGYGQALVVSLYLSAHIQCHQT
ncbi:hypothetical protein ABBQ32_006456 [Trebouxia sp. C0010 RCD-2024]